MKCKLLMLVVLLTFFSYSSFSDDFETGEKYFRMNKPSEAIVYFTKALDDVAVNLNVYNYLGICTFKIIISANFALYHGNIDLSILYDTLKSDIPYLISELEKDK